MHYILDNEGYVEEVSFGGIIECKNNTCSEYTGKVPTGYDTLANWFLEANIRAYKIVDGNLVLDPNRDYKLKILFDKEAEDNRHITKKELGITATDETNPYADLFPNKESLGMYINYTDEQHGKVGNFSTERVDIRNIEEVEDLDLIEVEFIGKNFLPNTATSTSNNGIEYTLNIDKTINVKGIATDRSTLNLAGTDTSIRNILTFKKGVQIDDDVNNIHTFLPYDYYLFGLEEGISLEFYHYDGTDRTLIGTYKNNDVITFDEDTNITQIVLVIEKGTPIDTLIKPMLSTDGNLAIEDKLPYLPMTKYHGKNLFDSENWYNTLHSIHQGYMSKVVVDDIEYYKFAPDTIYDHQYMKGQFKLNTQYTISCKARKYNDISDYSTGFVIYYTDGTRNGVYVENTLTEYDYIFVSDANKTIDYIRLSYNYNNYVLMRNIQLEEGKVATPYEEYDERNGQYYVDGVSTQVTRSGKNKLYWTRPTFGTIAENDDGSFNWSYPYAQNLSMELTGQLIAGTYTISNYGDINLFIQKSTSDYTTSVLKNGGTKTFTYDGTSYLRLLYGGSTPNVSQLFKLQLEEGSTATDYEAFGVSPSPDYPSEIVNIYKAGTYKAPLNNRIYYITLDDDLRGLPDGVADRLWFDIDKAILELEKKVGTKVLNGNENWGVSNTDGQSTARFTLSETTFKNYTSGYCNTNKYTTSGLSSDKQLVGKINNLIYYRIDKTIAETSTQFKTWLSTHNTELYCELVTYTNTYLSGFYATNHEYEEYKNNTTLIDLAGNKFEQYDSIVLEDNQAKLVKLGAVSNIDENEKETVFLGYVSMPRTYTPYTNAYCHQRLQIHSFLYRDCRNIDIKKIDINGTLEIDKVETNKLQVNKGRVYGEVVLFSGLTNGDIALKDYTSNYEYIEILYCDNGKNHYGSQKIYYPNNKKTTLSLTPFYIDGNNLYSYIYTGGISINGDVITRTGSTYVQMLNKEINNHTTDNYIYIYKVIGYTSGEVIEPEPEEPEEPIDPDVPIEVDNTKTISANGEKGHHNFTLEVDETSIVSNKSTIDYTFKMSAIQTGWNWNWSGQPNKLSYKITIGDNTYNGTIPIYDGSSTITLKNDSDIEIEHDADGSKTIPISFTVTDTTGANYTCGNASASADMTLTTI